MRNLKKISSVAILLIIILALSDGSAVHAIGVVDTIEVGASGVAYDSIMGEVFVSNGDSVRHCCKRDSSQSRILSL